MWVCPAAHSFDIARAGYVNLLQPQDRKSLDAGDSRDAVEARAALLARGIGRGGSDAVVSAVTALALPAHPVIVELGSGAGETLASLLGTREVCAVGIDLSTAAATLAARRLPAATWVVANADRRLPLLDASVDVVLSVHARRNPEECRRVLVPGGHLIVAIPAADDLIELREAVQGDAVERDRVDALLTEHAALFEVRNRTTVRQTFDLNRDDLLQVLRGTYRGERQSTAARVDTLTTLRVTFASDVVTFRRT